MHYSGLVIFCEPPSVDDCARELSECPGVDVYIKDNPGGRIVVVLETETVEEQEAGLRRVQDLPHVRVAELVYHYFGDAKNVPADPDAWNTLSKNSDKPGSRTQSDTSDEPK